ncbi:hypothetical protein [uncultured Algibacter sp.]|uniref:hypothetical protein n=1 Tax=uncultured Algibacter sp. TaxID=298659 RepID=UPI00321643F6
MNCKEGTENFNNEEVIEVIPKNDLIKEENLELIETLFDHIGYTIINWIETDRVPRKSPDVKPDLEGVKLNEFSKQNLHKRTLDYTKSLIKYRDSIEKETFKTKTQFNERLAVFLDSDFYTEVILKKNEDDLKLNPDVTYEKYLKNLEKVDNTVVSLINKSTKAYQEPEVLEKNIEQKTSDNDNESFKDSFNTYTWLLLGLFLVSLVLNFLQFFKHKKIKNLQIEALDIAKNEREKETYNHSSFQPKATKLRDSEVKSNIEQAYEKLQQALMSQYHKDCLQEVSLKFENLKTDTLLEASSSSFYNKTELQQFIDRRITQDKSTLSYELKNYVAKNDAKLEIDNRIAAQNFAQAVNTNIVKEEDIANKVRQLQQIAVSELPNVTTTAKLNTTINTLEKDIKMVLQKMVQDNSVFYFAFADANGTLQDIKKTKTIERDSAIQLSVNPDDITKATFRLLLEKDDMMQAGIMSYDSFLIPICELTSENFNSTGTTIQQIGPDGTMELENGIWKIKNKLPIKVI